MDAKGECLDMQNIREVVERAYNYDEGIAIGKQWYDRCEKEFREIEELKRLASYQVPKIVKAELYISTRCPSCKYDLSEHIDDGYHKVNKVKFCLNCGQALKWE